MSLHLLARQWLGTPFLHQGRSINGIDCVGLLRVCCDASPKYAHHSVADMEGYARDPHDGLLEKGLQAAFGDPVANVQVGDVVAMAFPTVVRHVAIIGDYRGGRLSLIHTWSAAERVVEHRLDSRWRALIRSAYRPEARNVG